MRNGEDQASDRASTARRVRQIRAALGALICLGLLAPAGAYASGVVTGQISRGAINGNGAFDPTFRGSSGDGSRVFFSSLEQLAATDADSSPDLYMREGSTTTQISQGAINGNGSFDPTFRGSSSDGSRVFFTTDEPLAGTDTDSSTDIYMREGSTTTQISQGAINGNGALAATFGGASTDGSRVFFESNEALAATDSDSSTDVYMREASTTTQISQGALNGNTGFTAEFRGAASDGSRVFFRSTEQLAATDTDGSSDVYMREGNTTTQISQGAINGNLVGTTGFSGASADGSRVILVTDEQLATTDTDSSQDLYVREGNTTTQISQGAIGGNGALSVFFAGISSDGSRVFFISSEQLASTDTDAVNDVYVREGTTTTEISQGAINGNGPNAVFFRGASADGSRAVFESGEQLTSSDTDAASDLYMRESTTTTQITQGAINGNGPIGVVFVGASADLTRIFFISSEQLASTDTDGANDVYMREGATTTQISQGAVNGDGPFSTSFGGASTDGSRAFFSSSEQLTASDTDASADIFAATIDLLAPDTQIDSGPSGPTSSNDPAFTYSGDPDNSDVDHFECRLDGGGFAACLNAGRSFADVAEGPHTFSVRAIDAADNADATPATRSFNVDTVKPNTQIDSGPSGPSSSNDPVFTYSGDPDNSDVDHFECRLDGGGFALCLNAGKSFTDLPDGGHTFQVQAVDVAGNIDASPASRSFAIDTVSPNTRLDSGPAGATNNNDPVFTYSGDPDGSDVDHFECSLDSGVFALCPNGNKALTDLPDGPHSFAVRAIDAADNLDGSPASRSFTIDTAPPETAITVGPASGSTTDDPTPTFEFSASEAASFECRVDAGGYASCESPLTLAALSDGAHTFEVRATDAAGSADTSSAARTFIVAAAPIKNCDAEQATFGAALAKLKKAKAKVKKAKTALADSGSDAEIEAATTKLKKAKAKAKKAKAAAKAAQAERDDCLAA